jgi:TRAP-type uncharacterized transport system substrate-binding protein
MRSAILKTLFPSLSAFCLALLPGSAVSQSIPLPAQPDRLQEFRREANDAPLSIVVSGLGCTCVRFAEDIRNVVTSARPGGMRLLPVLGGGGFQNVNDILFLRGVDMGIVDEDTLKLLKQREPALYRNVEHKIHYITTLYNAELHILARKEVKSLSDLEGRAVNFGRRDSQTHITADNVFNILQIAAERTFLDNEQALQRLIRGEIAAMIILSGGPQRTLAKIRKEDGLHLIPISEATVPGRGMSAIFDDYLPAELTFELYPALVEPGRPVPTIANRALLAVYNWPQDSERYRRIARFVQAFFDRIDQFHDRSRHPKWREINLAANVPGWIRFKAAQQWLDGKRMLVSAPARPAREAPDEMMLAFETFLKNYQASTGRKIAQAERESLYIEFRRFMDARATRRAAR